jgi:hypothetical protein
MSSNSAEEDRMVLKIFYFVGLDGNERMIERTNVTAEPHNLLVPDDVKKKLHKGSDLSNLKPSSWQANFFLLKCD